MKARLQRQIKQSVVIVVVVVNITTALIQTPHVHWNGIARRAVYLPLLWSPWNRADHYIFIVWFLLLFLSFFVT